MKSLDLNQRFLDILVEKYPQKKELSHLLMDILPIEKEAIYRRLRGEVPFAINELGVVAEALDISVDRLIGYMHVDFIPRSKKYPELNTDDENQNYRALVNYVEKIKEISAQPYSKHVHAMSYLPLGVCASYPYLLKFKIYMYFHLYGEIDSLKTYKSLELSDKVKKTFAQMGYYLDRISQTSYVWERSLLPHLIENIRYFIAIKLLTPEDIRALKEDLTRMLDDLENSAIKGIFKNTGNKFSLFISSVHMGFTHGYLWSEKSCVSITSMYIIQTFASFDEATCKHTEESIYSLSKLSTLISITGEKERLAFFREQRKLLELL